MIELIVSNTKNTSKIIKKLKEKKETLKTKIEDLEEE